jgi:hypothetical protein
MTGMMRADQSPDSALTSMFPHRTDRLACRKLDANAPGPWDP